MLNLYHITRMRRYVNGDKSVPQLNVSASINDKGILHISLCNLNPSETVEVTSDLRGATYTSVSGTILAADKMNAYNSFNDPNSLFQQSLKM